MKSPDLKEQEETDVYDNFAARNGSSTGKMTKQKASTNRSKHSVTEQLRRSKINERNLSQSRMRKRKLKGTDLYLNSVSKNDLLENALIDHTLCSGGSG